MDKKDIFPVSAVLLLPTEWGSKAPGYNVWCIIARAEHWREEENVKGYNEYRP
jgi:hypothetical protein